MPSKEDQIDSLIEKQIIEALSTYRTQFTLLTQMVTVVMLANISLIGFAITSNRMSFFYLGAICPILVLFIRVKANQLMLPVIYTAFHLERKLGGTNIDWIATTFIKTTFSSSIKLLQHIELLEIQEDRMVELKKITKKYRYLLFSQSNLLVTVICIIITAFEFTLPQIIKWLS